MAKEPKKLDELFHDTLKDIYFAEKKILATLPKMAKAADSEELKAAFESITARPRARSSGSNRCSRRSTKSLRARPVPPSSALPTKALKSCRNTRAHPRSTLDCLRPPRRSNTTKSPAMARSSRGRRSLAWMMLSRCSERLSTRKRPRTKLLRKSQKRRSISRPRLPDLSEWQMPRCAGHLLLIASATRQSSHCIRQRRNDELFETSDLGG